MLQRGLRAVTTLGGTIAVVGIVKEFFIYDGENSFLVSTNK